MVLRALHRTAYTVWCFFDALHVPDTRPRTEVEEHVVRWLADDKTPGRFVVFHRGTLFFHDRNGVAMNMPLTAAPGQGAMWCDGRKLSGIRSADYAARNAVVRTRTSNSAAPRPTAQGRGSAGFSSNNNNNNNNNNG